jgi:hypothetical protein
MVGGVGLGIGGGQCYQDGAQTVKGEPYGVQAADGECVAGGGGWEECLERLEG